MSLILSNPKDEVNRVVDFLQKTFDQQGKSSAVIAVSGGIDSALSLTLLSRALGPKRVFPILLPFADQAMDDAKAIVEWNEIPQENVHIVHIEGAVDEIKETIISKSNGVLRHLVGTPQDDKLSPVRKGNIMARVRMIYVYDLAKKLDALVVGTENKSEKYLGYFTRFGDGASDIEPIQHLYKTQVRQLALELQFPSIFLEKAPSAGLWEAQTDEDELGFSYAQADQVMTQFIDEKKDPKIIEVDGKHDEELVQKVIGQIMSQEFKHQVPYHL